VFEDLGYYCVDNLPPLLLPKIVDVVSERGRKPGWLSDGHSREGVSPRPLEVLNELRGAERGLRLFLDATDEMLVRRFSETRRKHPLAARGGALGAIRKERRILSPLRGWPMP